MNYKLPTGISKTDLCNIYKVKMNILERMIAHLHLPVRSNEEEIPEKELGLIFNDLGWPSIQVKKSHRGRLKGTTSDSSMLRHHFVVIDRDEKSALATEKMIRSIYPEAPVKTFNDMETGVELVARLHKDPPAEAVYIFLDVDISDPGSVNPLDKIATFPAGKKGPVYLYVLSASAHPGEMLRVKSHPAVADCIKKPLTLSRLTSILRR